MSNLLIKRAISSATESVRAVEHKALTTRPSSREQPIRHEVVIGGKTYPATEIATLALKTFIHDMAGIDVQIRLTEDQSKDLLENELYDVRIGEPQIAWDWYRIAIYLVLVGGALVAYLMRLSTQILVGVILFILGLGFFHWLAKFMTPPGGPELPPELKDGVAAANSNSDILLDLLRLEYENGVRRYEYIYQATWQNFSYMSIVSGGLLTLGSKQLDPRLLPFLALTPLVFWLFASFLPMDFYGQRIRSRLGAIEAQLTNTYFTKGGFGHFSDFARAAYKWHVAQVVKIFGFFICLAWVLAAVFAATFAYHKARSQPYSRNSAPDAACVATCHLLQTGFSSHVSLDGLYEQTRKVSERVHTIDYRPGCMDTQIVCGIDL